MHNNHFDKFIGCCLKEIACAKPYNHEFFCEKIALVLITIQAKNYVVA